MIDAWRRGGSAARWLRGLPELYVSVMACWMHAYRHTLRYRLTIVHTGNVTYSWYLLVL